MMRLKFGFGRRTERGKNAMLKLWPSKAPFTTLYVIVEDGGGRLISTKVGSPRPRLKRYEAETTVLCWISRSKIMSAWLISGLTIDGEKATISRDALAPAELDSTFGYTGAPASPAPNAI